MTKSLVLAAIAVVGAPSGALAQNAFDWSGFYAGIHAGSGSATTYLSNAIVNGTPMPVTAGNETQEASGLLGGFQIGGDMQIDSGFVLGLQSGFSLSSVKTTESGGDPSDTLNWLATTTGRVGHAFGRVLPYLEAGVAIASATGYAMDVPATALHTGWVAGAGLEVGVAESVSIGVKYNYIELGTQTYTFSGPSVGNISMDARQSVHAIKGGVNFRF